MLVRDAVRPALYNAKVGDCAGSESRGWLWINSSLKPLTGVVTGPRGALLMRQLYQVRRSSSASQTGSWQLWAGRISYSVQLQAQMDASGEPRGA